MVKLDEIVKFPVWVNDPVTSLLNKIKLPSSIVTLVAESWLKNINLKKNIWKT